MCLMRAAFLFLIASLVYGDPGSGIQRTMGLLADSTPAHRNRVRILFYGQSITKQEWSQLVAQDLRTRFPYADLSIENRAIGGYSTEYLIRTLPHDVYGFYPDLIIFHDYGGQENYAKIIEGIRRNTTAELLIQTDYPTWIPTEAEPANAAKEKRELFHQQHSFEWLPQLCAKHGCGLVDVRRPWLEHLKQNHLPANALLSDGVHLNVQGNQLLAEITKLYLVVAAPVPSAVEKVKPVWENARLRQEFTGNRIELVAAKGPVFHAAGARVLIDGKPPASFAITRPTDTYAVDWPAINHIEAVKPLIAEDWTLQVTSTNPDDSEWKFNVIGSRTGADGEGTSTTRFVSNSGRVVIEPTDWGVKRAFDLKKRLTPVGFEVKWKVVPEFVAFYESPRIVDPALEYITVIASGLSNGKHTLELISAGKTDPPIQELRIYRPPLQ